jgi:hypothetical protein
MAALCKEIADSFQHYKQRFDREAQKAEVLKAQAKEIKAKIHAQRAPARMGCVPELLGAARRDEHRYCPSSRRPGPICGGLFRRQVA